MADAYALPTLSAAKARAFGLIIVTLGREPPLDLDLFALPTLVLVDMVMAVEEGLCIPLDIDEAYDAGTIGGLLDVVEAKLHPWRRGHRTGRLIDFAEVRRQQGLPPFAAPEVAPQLGELGMPSDFVPAFTGGPRGPGGPENPASPPPTIRRELLGWAAFGFACVSMAAAGGTAMAHALGLIR